MKNNLLNIKERVLQLAENVEVSKQEFFRKINITYGNFTGEKKKRPLNSDAIENILLIYPQTNPAWLLTGKGKMLVADQDSLQPPSYDMLTHNKDKDKGGRFKNKSEKTLLPDKNGLPLIPLDAMAGYGEGSMQILEHELERYYVPEFAQLNATYMIRVKGNSMQPRFNSGDIVACKQLELSGIFFQWNKVYVLDTAQGPLIKRIHKGPDDKNITLISDNEEYSPFDIAIADLNAVALVVGVIGVE